MNPEHLGESTRYIVVIDTDSYAGNFERELAAAALGLLGQTERGAELAARTQERVPEQVALFENIASIWVHFFRKSRTCIGEIPGGHLGEISGPLG